ncbi:hypothetical protein [Gehongia tenuis]|uniref:Uncharacterized protein n=1 Tax=Gehongia tenuis TaxID=2763655 RepID=A0A926HJU9_9FIRM|nr:hypothetical protein [Gehongia tenuis]MBC8530267.1 hypothetical protein [Gehongia tenuis]
MKKIVVKLLIFFMPVFLWISLFTSLDPYDYWNFFNDYRGFEEGIVTPLPRMRKYLNSDTSTLLLGDSRTAYVWRQMKTLGVDDEYANLAFGGASLKESIDLFWFAAEKRKPERVIFQISFYTMNSAYALDRVPQVVDQAENVFQYYLNFDHNRLAFNNLKQWVAPIKVEPEPELPRAERRAKELEYVSVPCADYSINEEMLNGLIEIAQYCNNEGIELYFITPPMHRDFWDQIVDRYELQDELDYYKAKLSQYAPIYDMEWRSDIIDSEDFTDGMHFDGLVREGYVNLLITKQNPYCRIWEKGAVI